MVITILAAGILGFTFQGLTSSLSSNTPDDFSITINPILIRAVQALGAFQVTMTALVLMDLSVSKNVMTKMTASLKNVKLMMMMEFVRRTMWNQNQHVKMIAQTMVYVLHPMYVNVMLDLFQILFLHVLNVQLVLSQLLLVQPHVLNVQLVLSQLLLVQPHVLNVQLVLFQVLLAQQVFPHVFHVQLVLFQVLLAQQVFPHVFHVQLVVSHQVLVQPHVHHVQLEHSQTPEQHLVRHYPLLQDLKDSTLSMSSRSICSTW